MKQSFRAAAVFTAIILTTIQFTAAQAPTKKFATEQSKIAFVTKNILASFQSGNEGVIESSLRLSAEMRMRYPSPDMSEIIKAMQMIKKNHANGTIRYKAFVAISVCENPEWYSQLMNSYSENSDAFFRSASKVMNEQLLTATN